MKVSVFGLGYVGCVTAACFASQGHQVLGVDINPDKVAAFNEGRSPIIEPGLEELVRTAVAEKRLAATQDVGRAVAHADVVLICVGTPSMPNGNLDISYVERVGGQIGQALRDIDDFKVVILRSTVLPGTVRDRLLPALTKRSGKEPGVDFGVVANP
jgi:GDP-mannose 6-dehydrogenase